MRKSAILFRCPNCIQDIETKKAVEDLKEITLENGSVYSLDEIEIIEVEDTFKCGVCGTIVKDIVLDDTYEDKPWYVFKQDGDPVDNGIGKNFHMALAGKFETFKEAYDTYNREYKEDGKCARINLKSTDQMIVVCSIGVDNKVSYPINFLKGRPKTNKGE